MTTNNFTAVRAIWTRLDNFPKAPWNDMPISSIYRSLQYSKVCCTRIVGMQYRKCVCS
jgi:hypothetical protein